MKASAFRRWPVAGAYSPEQTTRLTGGSDLKLSEIFSVSFQQSFLYWGYLKKKGDVGIEKAEHIQKI